MPKSTDKCPENPKTWGYALKAPRRPSLKKQLEILAYLGLDTSDTGPIWRDELDSIKRGPRPEDRELAMRSDLLEMVAPGDRVIVASPDCLGVSAKDAEMFIRALQAKGVALMVWEHCWRVQPDDDPASLIDEVDRRHNRVYRRAWRAKRKSQS